MRTSDVLEHFKTQVEIAKTLGISEAAVSKWGGTVPEGSAYKLQVLTKNKLRVNPADYAKKPSAAA